ncbi:hypothetical protein [Dyella sp.]|uniref:hypothetical protein n=1 Tax=Dyella sp. TaxID=1869338 RepID=UPI003F7E119F
MSKRILELALLLGGATLLGMGTQACATSTQKPPAVGVDAQAARDQFHDAKRCFELGLQIEATANVNQICKSLGPHAAQDKRCSSEKAAMRSKRIIDAQKEQASCSADPIVLEKKFHTALVTAAKAGDIDAEVCYIGGWSPLDPKERNAYIKNAQAYISKGLSRGDWRVIELMSRSPADGGAGIMINLPNFGSHFTTYRFNRLLQLGATGDFADIARVNADNEARFLTRTQVVNGNEWAREEYRKHFANSPKLTAAPTPCLSNSPDE